MNKFFGQLCMSLSLFFYSGLALCDKYALPDVDSKSIFDGDSKPVAIFTFASWAVVAMAALVSIAGFIACGNFLTTGQWKHAAGAFLGGVICACGTYFVAGLLT